MCDNNDDKDDQKVRKDKTIKVQVRPHKKAASTMVTIPLTTKSRFEGIYSCFLKNKTFLRFKSVHQLLCLSLVHVYKDLGLIILTSNKLGSLQ